MNRIWTIIGVRDVPVSIKWYRYQETVCFTVLFASNGGRPHASGRRDHPNRMISREMGGDHHGA